MNAPHSPSPLAAVEMAPKDPILGVTEAFVADTNPRKVNLGVGVYYDDDGKVPVLECVKRVEAERAKAGAPKSYLPIDGLAAYDKAVRELVFGLSSSALKENRVVTVQAIGGSGGLKVGADFLRQICPGAAAWISDPSWENHRALFEGAGFAVKPYPYYDPATHGVKFEAMLAALRAMPAGSIVVLHSCCHNPTGVDLSQAQWREVLAAVQARGLIPFLDLAYQGFADGLDADAFAPRLFAEAMHPVFLASSFSKSVSLYGERVGALSVVTGTPDEAARVLSNLKRVVRANYSNPPTTGADIVSRILASPELRRQWDDEVAGMRDRIKAMRQAFAERLRKLVPGRDFSFVLKQKGLFSYSGLSAAQVRRLRDEFSIYAVESGRICVAALTTKNIDYVTDAVARTVR